MNTSIQLSNLDWYSFESMVNYLALKVLGLGATGFGPGADGGRDGYFEGEAPYPSESNRWTGVWYIQSKFHRPHLSDDHQKWIQAQIKAEIKSFEENDRVIPDNWIIATNIDLSANQDTGSFDVINDLVASSSKLKKVRVHVWQGRRILDLLNDNPQIASYYGHFLTPGHVLTELQQQLVAERTTVDQILRYLAVTQFTEQLYTKLDQANASSDIRAGVHDLFIDLPYVCRHSESGLLILRTLCAASANNHRYSLRSILPESLSGWTHHPKRARVSLLKGGPGQGKSTVTQYLCQINRAALILQSSSFPVTDAMRQHAENVKRAATMQSFWPNSPRVPLHVELKNYAKWYYLQKEDQSRSILSFVAAEITRRTDGKVAPNTLKSMLQAKTWLVVFDGLDEVPGDIKDLVAREVVTFVDDVLVSLDSDALCICTSRPQGYSGQFSGLDGPTIDLSLLNIDQALECAKPLLTFGRSHDEAERDLETLTAASSSEGVQQLMKTPLQSHILAIVVREGGRPPEKRWALFHSFYSVMRKRESMKNFPDPKMSRLLKEGDKLLMNVHSRLGFVLHARAERSSGAQTTLSRQEFRQLVRDVVTQLGSTDVEDSVRVVMDATVERLVLVSTPDTTDEVRFDIRQLQEFFAAEFLYSGVGTDELGRRVEVLGADPHWREVLHFILSALIEKQRPAELAMAVAMLRVIDDGDSPRKLFSRKLARSCLLSVRLLLEGVLEQDRHDRQLLRPLFDPLGGMIDSASIIQLARLELPNSKEWLASLLVDCVARSATQERMAAIQLLGWLLPESSPHAQLLKVAVRNSPPGLVGVLFEQWATNSGTSSRFRSHEEMPAVSGWVVEIALEYLANPSWCELPYRQLHAIQSLCEVGEARLVAAFVANGWDENIGRAFLKVLTFCDEDTSDSEEVGETLELGIFRARHFSTDWANELVPDELRSIDAEVCTNGSTGYLQVVFSAVWFAQTRSVASLRVFYSGVPVMPGPALYAMPDKLRALVPLGWWTAGGAPARVDVGSLPDSCVSSKSIAAAANTFRRPFRIVSVDSRSVLAEESWKMVAQEAPLLAIDIALGQYRSAVDGSGEPDLKLPPEVTVLFFKHLERSSAHFSRWGVLTRHHSDVLDSLKKASRDFRQEDVEQWYSYLSRAVPFPLSLPHDIHLLEYVACAIGSGSNYGYGRRSYRNSHNISRVREFVGGYGLTSEALQGIVSQSSFDKDARAAALAIHWMLDGAKSPGDSSSASSVLSVKSQTELYWDLVSDRNEKWLAMALVEGLLIHRSELEPGSIEFATKLIEHCDSGDGPLFALQSLLFNWRERSSSPVQSSQVLNDWLAYIFSAPNYQ